MRTPSYSYQLAARLSQLVYCGYMVQLGIWQKKRWLKLRKERLAWQAKNPGKFRPTLDPFEIEISNYDCALCGERKWYRTNGSDKDIPQYHQIGKRWIRLCHACWHLKGIYKKHQKASSLEGLSGCRVCHLQLAAKRNRKRNTRSEPGQDRANGTGQGQTGTSAANLQPTRVRNGTNLPEVRQRGTDEQRERPARRVRRKVSYA